MMAPVSVKKSSDYIKNICTKLMTFKWLTVIFINASK